MSLIKNVSVSLCLLVLSMGCVADNLFNTMPDAATLAEQGKPAEDPYEMELTCTIGNMPGNMTVTYIFNCADSLKIVYAGRTDAYSMYDFVQRQEVTFKRNLPEHFDLILESGHKRNLFAKLIIRDRKTGKEIYQGNTSQPFDVLRVAN